MIPPLGTDTSSPSQELSHFTNRVDELIAYKRVLEIPHGQPTPLLMFYGVGGAGKSWLLKRFRQQTLSIPTVYIDLDPRLGSQSLGNNPSRALAEIRRQLGDGMKCPRFDLAYAWLRYKEGNSDEPLFKGAGFLGDAWEFIVEAGTEWTESGLTGWLLRKFSGPVDRWLEKSGVKDWISSELGQKDFLILKAQHFTDIYPQLNKRLLLDLQEHLPENNGCSAKAVIYLDTIEATREGRASPEQIDLSQTWLRDLYHPDSGLLVVMSGRDRLQWDRDSTSDYSNPKYLEQHLVGGLSKPDAVLFLVNCQIIDKALQKAILAVSLDTETRSRGSGQHSGYHAFSLGLCADTCWNLVQRNEIIDPDSFDMSSADTHALAACFLRSMGGDGTYAQWLKSLALTPQFDEAAARTRFSEHTGAEQDAAWQALISYSFFRRTQQSGWYALHARMRESLADGQHLDDPALWQSQHGWWHRYWQDQSNKPTDTMAAKAWYHTWCTDPNTANKQWKQLAETAHERLDMADHYALLDWWTPCEFTMSTNDKALQFQNAIARNLLGVELYKTTLGDRAANVQRAIECHKAALRVLTENTFPLDSAMTKFNLGVAYWDLPVGNRAANLQRAIAYFEDALQVLTEEAYPLDWAMTQCHVGFAYRVLPDGDRAANVQRAIACYENALRVHTERAFPRDWAMTQHNLAIAYRNLPIGDQTANVQRAINHYEAALRVFTEQHFPRDWARAKNNLGFAYINLSSGDKAANIKYAIKCCKSALRVRTEQVFPQGWAITQNTLGSAYLAMPFGDRAGNLQHAIECFEASLRVRTEQIFPQEWAMTQNNLANAYRNIPGGDRAANIQLAIECFEAALRVYTEQAFPQEYKIVLDELESARKMLK